VKIDVRISQKEANALFKKREGKPRSTKITPPLFSEHDIQKAFFQWVNIAKNQYPELNLMYSIPNGGKRNIQTAIKLKAEGVKSGVPDVALPIMRGGFIGLFIEFKKPKETLTENQKNFIEKAIKEKNALAVAFSFEQAKAITENFLNGQFCAASAAISLMQAGMTLADHFYNVATPKCEIGYASQEKTATALF
jgi:hypothetical protein